MLLCFLRFGTSQIPDWRSAMTSECPITFHHRRAILKTGLAASAAMALGIPVTSTAAAEAAKLDNDIAWHKGVCRFCGTGCGLQVGVRKWSCCCYQRAIPMRLSTGASTVSRATSNAKILYGGPPHSPSDAHEGWKVRQEWPFRSCVLGNGLDRNDQTK